MEIDLAICKIRQWQWKDKESLARNANNRKVWINLRDRFPSPYTQADAENWLKMVADKKPVTEFAIEVDNKAVGGIGFLPDNDVHRLQAEIGYWLGEDYWGRGIATTALNAITEYAFKEFKLIRLYANVFDWNTASTRVLEKAGYNFEARLKKSVIKDGKIIDQLIFARVK